MSASDESTPSTSTSASTSMVAATAPATVAVTTRGKRPNQYARRTCRACRENKKRCVMPPASLLLVPSYDEVGEACARCARIGLACVLDDFKRRGRRPVASVAAAPALETRVRRRTGKKEQKSDQKVELLGSRLIMLEVARQVIAADAAPPEAAVEMPSSMSHLDRLIDDDVCQEVSYWSEQELRLWFPFLPTPWELRCARSDSKPSSASVVLEVGQYLIAANHTKLLSHCERAAVSLAEPLLKTALAEILLERAYDEAHIQALQLLSVFQASGGLSMPLVAACKTAARFGLSSNPSPLSSSSPSSSSSSPSSSSSSPAAESKLRAGLAWCNACMWDASFLLGMREGVEHFQPEEFPSIAYVEDLMAQVEKLSWTNVGVHNILVRCLTVALAAKAWIEGGSLAEWNESFEGCLQPRVAALNELQKPLASLELHAANSLLHGRRLAAILGPTLARKVALLGQGCEMEAFVQQRRYIIDRASARQPLSDAQGKLWKDLRHRGPSLFEIFQKDLSSRFHPELHQTAKALLSTLTSSQTVQEPEEREGRLPSLQPYENFLFFFYQAATVALRTHSPILTWFSTESSDVEMQSVARLIQALAEGPEEPDEAIVRACAKVESDLFYDVSLDLGSLS